MKILIVDDEFTSRKIIHSVASNYGSCDFAMDGEEAVFAFKLALKENEPYDLIFLDIMMPKMDGQQVLNEIRTIEKERGIIGKGEVKIIMETALSDPENIMTAFKSECEDYITKPLDTNEIRLKMKELKLIE